LHPFSRKSLGVLCAGILAMASVYFIPVFSHPIVDTILRTVIIMLVYVLALIFLKPSADLNEYLQSIVKNKRLF